MLRSKIWAWGLVVSLSLNAFVLAFFATHRPPLPFGKDGPPPPSEIIGHILKGLPADDAVILKKALEPHMDSINASYPVTKEAMARYRRALTAENFNAEDMNAALMDMRRARNQFENAINAAMLEAARDMSSEGRRKLWLGPPPP